MTRAIPAGVALAGLVTALLATACPVAAMPAVVDDGIPAALAAGPGDPARGRAIVADRTKGLCLLCHAAPIPEERFQGNLAPTLAGAGSRWSPAQLRLRVADARRLNADTIMPSYLATEGRERVGAAWRDRSILTAAEIEDVVAYLSGLRDP